MCGIAGVVTSDPNALISRTVLAEMAKQIAHRGPDAQGTWCAPGIGLAHRRLSIIDLGGGEQPLANEDGQVIVVFNGEIYNYRTLREQLVQRGHRFKTHSDTEVLVHLYEEYGRDLVSQLRGMFAFAIWDNKQRQLLLARDRVGQKPLYVYRDRKKIVFGSEIKAILACPDVEHTIDEKAIHEYFTYGVIPGSRSIFQQIIKLLPGHTLVYCPGADQLSIEPYWEFRPSVSPGLSPDEWIEAIEDKLQETVRLHMIADVPVGAFLSGGVDSSLIVATAAKLVGEPLRTFSIGFQEQSFSELPFARAVADRFGTRHVEQIVTADVIASLHRLVYHYDEPFADSSAIPTMRVAEVARQDVKVVLSGDGGDEGFGGYARYSHDIGETRIRRWIPNWIRRTLLSRAAGLWPQTDWLPRPLRAKSTLTNIALEPAAAYARTLSISSPGIRQHLLHPDLLSSLNGYCPDSVASRHFERTEGDVLQRMCATDIAMFLPDDFLTKVDRASMAVGLEVRPPLVDHELLELAGCIPSRWKVRRGETKWILKQLCARNVPAEIIWRRKQGFEMPVDQWLRGPLRGLFHDQVLANAHPIGQFINQREAARLYQAHCQRGARHGALLWATLVLGCWLSRPAESATLSPTASVS